MKTIKKVSPEELTNIIYDRMKELADLVWAMFFTVTGYDVSEEGEWEHSCDGENCETADEFAEIDDDNLPF